MQKIIDVLLYPFKKIKEKYYFRKRMKELKKRDPFIYK